MERPPEPSSSTFLSGRSGAGGGTYLPAESASCTDLVGSFMASTKTSKRKEVSLGPVLASGWNCAETHGLVECMRPSLEPSLRLTKRGVQSSGSWPSLTSMA